MIFSEIIGTNIIELRHYINNFLKKLLNHGIGNENLNMNVLEISSAMEEPTEKPGKIIIYMDNAGNLLVKKPDGTIKIITLL